MKFIIEIEDPSSKDATLLMQELSLILKGITGSSGAASFNIDDLKYEKSCFLIARDEAGKAIACGSIRAMEDHVAEIKRMYTRVPGVGAQVLKELEKKATGFGYTLLKLETRKVNTKAVNFYLRNGYAVIDNYGKYIGNDKAVCFGKNIKAKPI